MNLKIFLLDSSPQKIIDNLKRMGYVNTSNALIPIKVTFPDLMRATFNKKEDLELVRKEVGKMLFTIHSVDLSRYSIFRGFLG